MLGWLHRAWSWGVNNVGDPVASWVRDLFHGVWGFLHTIFGHVIDAWPFMWHAFRNIWRMFDSFATWVGWLFKYLYQVWIPRLYHVLLRLYHNVLKYAQTVYHWAVRMFDWFKHWVSKLIDAVRTWVINDIWKPLYRSLLAVWHWINHEGSILWYYITHPDKLVDLVWDALIAKLETEAWNIGGKLGRFSLALIVHNLRRFLLLLEDIVNAVL